MATALATGLGTETGAKVAPALHLNQVEIRVSSFCVLVLALISARSGYGNFELGSATALATETGAKVAPALHLNRHQNLPVLRRDICIMCKYLDFC